MNKAPPSEAAVQMLTENASYLPVEDILELCFAFAKDPIRLTIYLDVLRRKGGYRAQAAACMICFDLARAGYGHFEREFSALLPVIGDLLQKGTAHELIGDSAYLHILWQDLQRRYEQSDFRQEPKLTAHKEVEDVIEINLFDDADILDIQLDEIVEVAHDPLHQDDAWHDALDHFFVIELAMTALQGGGTAGLATGFSANTRRDLARLESMHFNAISYASSVPHARDMLPIIDIFRAAHMRARNLFGRKNQERADTLAVGLTAFMELPEPPENVAAWLTSPTATPHAWEKVAEILLDFMTYLAQFDEGCIAGDDQWAPRLAFGYANETRQVPDALNPSPGKRRR